MVFNFLTISDGHKVVVNLLMLSDVGGVVLFNLLMLVDKGGR